MKLLKRTQRKLQQGNSKSSKCTTTAKESWELSISQVTARDAPILISVSISVNISHIFNINTLVKSNTDQCYTGIDIGTGNGNIGTDIGNIGTGKSFIGQSVL